MKYKITSVPYEGLKYPKVGSVVKNLDDSMLFLERINVRAIHKDGYVYYGGLGFTLGKTCISLIKRKTKRYKNK